jgi:dehydrogenase/reductase SDR family protein 4
LCAAKVFVTLSGGSCLGPDGITVNCVAPGIVPTKFSAALVADKELVSAFVANNRFLGRV